MSFVAFIWNRHRHEACTTDSIQIRYYEENGLMQAERTKGYQRLIAFHDVDLEFRNFLDKGLNFKGIKLLLAQDKTPEQLTETNSTVEISKQELRIRLRNELTEVGRLGKVSLRQGELSRYFDNRS